MPALGVPAGSTVLVSLPTGFTAPFDGVNASDVGQGRALSADGRYAVFTSESDGLVPGAADDAEIHCYRRDLVSGETLLIDRATGAGGAIANESCAEPTISSDGSAVAFTTKASNLVPGDTNGQRDVFVRRGGATTRVSVDVNGAQVDGISSRPSVTVVSGTKMLATVVVAFESTAPLDPARDAGTGTDVYVRTIPSLTFLGSSTTLVSRSGGDMSNFVGGLRPAISRDGTKIAFESNAGIDPADTGQDTDIYVRDTVAKTTTLASRPTGVATEANGFSFSAVISADGGSVAFVSSASNLGGAPPPLLRPGLRAPPRGGDDRAGECGERERGDPR